METFREYLNEQYIIQDKKFIDSIEGWVDQNDVKYLKYIIKNKNKIPAMFRKKDFYYRGFTLNDSDFEKLDSGNGITFDKPTSWTTDVKIAEKFISDPKYKIGSGGKNKFILKKKFEPIINIWAFTNYALGAGLLVDFDEIALDSALKEFEVLADSGIKINKKDIHKKIK